MTKRIPLPKRPLLVQRLEAARLLNVDRDSLKRMEAAGTLKAIRLSKTPKARNFYRMSDIEALAEHGVDRLRTARAR